MRLDATRPPRTDVVAKAAADAHPDGVGLDLTWSDIEPRPPAAGGKHTYTWEASGFDATVDALRAAGVRILTIRVTSAPDWAVQGKVCKYKACPPTPAHYSDFGDFVHAAVRRYGPGGTTGADIQHWSLWNEPNQPTEWGGEDVVDASYKAYSDLLAVFHAAAVGANDQVKVDAGEIAADGPRGDNAPKAWTRDFYKFNKSKEGRDGTYDFVTIHAYSEEPSGVAAKLRAYQRLFAGHPVAATEFGWAVGAPRHGASWKCVPNEQAQAANFTAAVQAVRADPSLEGVPWLIWFEGIDDDLSGAGNAGPNCPPHTWYDARIRPHMNTFGLYERAKNGSAGEVHPRTIVGSFSVAAR